jgi:isopenicillin N synthase-like dioxygenase
LSDFLAGKPGALEATAGELCHTSQEVGFYFIRGHGVPWNIVGEAFAASRRYHALPLEEKIKLNANQHNVGYMPSKTSISRASKIYDGEQKPIWSRLFP